MPAVLAPLPSARPSTSRPFSVSLLFEHDPEQTRRRQVQPLGEEQIIRRGRVQVPVVAVEQDGRGHRDTPLETARDTLSKLQVSAARQHHQGLLRMLLEVTGGALGHPLVPQELDLQEALEGLLLGRRVHVEHRLDPVAIGLILAVDVRGDAGALLGLEALDPDIPHPSGELGLQVQRDHRDAVFAGETQDRPVQPVVVAPAVEVLGATEEFGLVDLPGDIGVQGRLVGLLEELHADGQILAPALQSLDDLELVQVVLVTVVALADEDHPAVRDGVQQPVHVGDLAGVHDPGVRVRGRRRHRGGGLSCAVGIGRRGECGTLAERAGEGQARNREKSRSSRSHKRPRWCWPNAPALLRRVGSRRQLAQERAIRPHPTGDRAPMSTRPRHARPLATILALWVALVAPSALGAAPPDPPVVGHRIAGPDRPGRGLDPGHGPSDLAPGPERLGPDPAPGPVPSGPRRQWDPGEPGAGRTPGAISPASGGW